MVGSRPVGSGVFVIQKLVVRRSSLGERAELEFLDDAQAEGAALEPIFSEVLVKAVKVDRQGPRDVGQAELASHSVDLIERTSRGAAAIVGDLPRIVASWPDFR